MKGEKRPGDLCSIPSCTEDMVAVNEAVICPKCDAVDEWPNVKRGQAKIVK